MNHRFALISSLFLIGCGSGDSSATPGDSSLGDVGVCGDCDGSTGDVAHDATTDGATDTHVPPADAPWDVKLPPPPDQPQLWYWHHSYLSATNSSEPAQSKALIDKAAAAGYGGLAFWDSSMDFLQRPGWDASKLKEVITYAASKGLKVLPTTAPFGYSDGILKDDPNLAEGQRVIGSQFKVSGGTLVFQNSQPAIPNGDFESGTTGWFGMGDARVSRDTTVAHTGSASAHITGSASASDNARLMQKVSVIPFRLYHLSLWIKTNALSRNHPTINVLDFDLKPGTALSRYYEDVSIGSTADWTHYDFTFDSRESKSIGIYIGMWGGNSGDAWFDDITFEETALVNVLRRTGTPLKVYDTTTTYGEGTDFDKIADPALAAHPGSFDAWHVPPVPTVPSGSKLKDGALVSIDSYSVFPIAGFQVGSCLTEPAIQDWEKKNLAAQDGVFPKDATFAGWFFDYDEMRQMHSCETCRAAATTAGDLLAWHVGVTTDEAHAVRPGATIYVWNDMFDPTHNAHDDYYFVEGDIAGSWAGLKPGTMIMNWIRTPASLKWFSGTDAKQPHPFQQILAGYYDSGDGAKSAADDIAAAKGVPGIVGAMYTAWTDDYTQLAQYAKGIKDGWASYKSSVP